MMSEPKAGDQSIAKEKPALVPRLFKIVCSAR